MVEPAREPPSHLCVHRLVASMTTLPPSPSAGPDLLRDKARAIRREILLMVHAASRVIPAAASVRPILSRRSITE